MPAINNRLTTIGTKGKHRNIMFPKMMMILLMIIQILLAIIQILLMIIQILLMIIQILLMIVFRRRRWIMKTMVRLPANNANYYNSEMRMIVIKNQESQ